MTQLIFDIVIGVLALCSIVLGTINIIALRARNQELRRYWQGRRVQP